MKVKRAFRTIMTVLSLLFFLSGCSLFESDKEKAERFVQLGMAAQKEKKTDDAILQFKNALQKDPLHPIAHYALGEIYFKAEKPQLAAMELSLAISQDSELIKAKQLLSELYFRYGAYDKAIPLLKELAEKNTPNLETVLMLGNALVNTGQGAEAKAVLEKAEKANPDNVEVKISLARALLLMSRPEEARKMMEKAASLKPKDISIQVLLARFYENAELYDLAQNKLLAIKNSFPKNPVTYLSLARFYLRRNRLSDAEKALDEAIDMGLKDKDLYHALGLIQHKKKEYQAALNSFNTAVTTFPDDQKSLILLADYYVFLKDYPKAKSTYEKIAGKWPQLLPVKSKIAELFIAERDYDQALKQVEKMLDEDPDYARGYVLRGLLWLKKGETKKARDEFLRARDLDPSSGEGDYFYGLTFLNDRDYRMSLSEILKALEKDPNSLKIRLALAYIYFRTEKPSLALSELNRILDVQPDNLRARMLRGRVYAATKQYEKAEFDYQYIIGKSPDVPVVRLRLAQVYRAQGKLDQALKGFIALLDADKAAFAALRGITGIYVSRKEFDTAIGLLDREQKKQPQNLRIGLLKVAVLLAQRDYGSAEETLSDLIKKHPEAVEPLALLANLHMNRQDARQDYGAALKVFHRILDIDPKNIPARMRMAYLYKKLGDMDNAILSYDAVLKIDENYAAAVNDLAYLYADMDQHLDEALVLAKKAQQLIPDNPDVEDTLGWVYLKRGSLLLANRHIRHAIGQKPEEPLFHFHLGLVLYAQNDTKEAAIQLKDAIKLGLGKNELPQAKKLLQAMKDPAHHYVDILDELERALQDQNLDQALSLAKKAQELMPDSPEIADKMGTIYLKKGSFLLAKKKFREAIEGMPNNALFRFHMGLLLYEEQDFAQAGEAFEKAIKLGLQPEKAEIAGNLIQKAKGRME